MIGYLVPISTSCNDTPERLRFMTLNAAIACDHKPENRYATRDANILEFLPS